MLHKVGASNQVRGSNRTAPGFLQNVQISATPRTMNLKRHKAHTHTTLPRLRKYVLTRRNKYWTRGKCNEANDTSVIVVRVNATRQMRQSICDKAIAPSATPPNTLSICSFCDIDNEIFYHQTIRVFFGLLQLAHLANFPAIIVRYCRIGAPPIEPSRRISIHGLRVLTCDSTLDISPTRDSMATHETLPTG